MVWYLILRYGSDVLEVLAAFWLNEGFLRDRCGGGQLFRRREEPGRGVVVEKALQMWGLSLGQALAEVGKLDDEFLVLCTQALQLNTGLLQLLVHVPVVLPAREGVHRPATTQVDHTMQHIEEATIILIRAVEVNTTVPLVSHHVVRKLIITVHTVRFRVQDHE